MLFSLLSRSALPRRMLKRLGSEVKCVQSLIMRSSEKETLALESGLAPKFLARASIQHIPIRLLYFSCIPFHPGTGSIVSSHCNTLAYFLVQSNLYILDAHSLSAKLELTSKKPLKNGKGLQGFRFFLRS